MNSKKYKGNSPFTLSLVKRALKHFDNLFSHIEEKHIFCIAVSNSIFKSNRYVDIFPEMKINVIKSGHYYNLVVSERFQELNEAKQLWLICHALLHIPKEYKDLLYSDKPIYIKEHDIEYFHVEQNIVDKIKEIYEARNKKWEDNMEVAPK